MPATSPSPAAVQTAAEEKTAEQQDPRWQPMMTLPCGLTVDLALRGFKVADFLRLRPGSVVKTEWGVARDVPVRVNGILIGWGELEGAGNRPAVRMTELA